MEKRSQKNIEKIIDILKKEYPNAKIALNFGNEFELLVAVILSAQCTDERVNKVTPALFQRFPSVKDYAGCDLEELEKFIFSTGFYRNKAKNIQAAAQMVIENFNGKIPNNMDDLLKIPGVARKTANVVLNIAFGKNEGIVVDTHVARISGLLGLVDMEISRKKNAVAIEKELMRIVPKKNWGIFPHLLTWHGRKICVARRPKCGVCPLNRICPSAKAD